MNDFDPSSGSVAATDNKRTPEQKQLMLNNILTGVQIAQNAKMNGALENLKRETQVQTQHPIASTNPRHNLPGFPYEKSDRNHLPDDCCASWKCGGELGNNLRV